MEEEFEKGKRYLIEGLVGFMGLFKPYLKLSQGMKLLGISELLEGSRPNSETMVNADLWNLALNNLVSDMKGAKNKDEMLQAIENHREFVERLL